MKWSILIVSLAVWGCGSDDDDDAPVIEYGTLEVDSATDEEDGTYSLTSVSTCTLDTNSGLFTASLGGPNNAALEVEIRDFSTEDKTYSCTQQSNNNEGEVGSKYSSCGVRFTIAASTKATSSYGMYRHIEDLYEFTYEGSCSISIEYSTGRATGNIQCTNMVQTYYEGTIMNPNNPDDNNATLSSGTSFYCDVG